MRALLEKNRWRELVLAPLGIQSLLVIISFLTLLGQHLPKFGSDPGLGWHLADGAQISATRAIPRVDTFLSESRAWISDQWLSDLILFRTYEYGGWPFLYAVLLVVYVTTFFGIVYPATRSICKGTLSASLATFLAFKLSLIHFILRPVIFSFALFAALVMLTFGPVRNQLRTGKSLSRGAWIVIPLLFLLWAQIHPSFVLGLLLLGLLLLGGLADRVLFARPVGSLALLKTGLLVLVSAGVTLENPYGLLLHESIASLGQSDYFMHLNLEWRPIQLASLPGKLFLLLLATVAVVALIARRRLGWGSFEYLALLVFATLAARAVRMLPHFAIVSVVPLTEVLCWLATTEWVRRGFVLRLIWPSLNRVGQREARTGSGARIVIILSAVVMIDSLLHGRLLIFQGPFGPSQDAYPYDGVRAIMAQSQQAERKPVVITTPDWGGFIVWESKGRLLPQIDDRNTMIGEHPYRAVIDALNNPDTLESYARAMQGDYILVPSKSEPTSSPNLALLYKNAHSVAMRLK